MVAVRCRGVYGHATLFAVLLSLAGGQPDGAQILPPGAAPGDMNAPSEEDKANAGMRVVESLDQRPCVNNAPDEQCIEFAGANQCEENKRWMFANCEATCKRCIDHIPFWHGGNVTHVATKKSLAALRKRDVKMLVMFHHTGGACPDCDYARPFFARVASDIKQRLPEVEVTAAVDCAKIEKSCLKLRLVSATGKLPVFRFYGDTDHWSKLSDGGKTYGTPIEANGFFALQGIIDASDKFDEELFAYEEQGDADSGKEL